LSPGRHLLTPTQALGYVRARYTLGDGSDLERITRQQAFMSSLVSRVRSELYNPLAIYRFLDAFTKSLTVDTQLGGITGLYDLGQSLRAIPSSKIAFFTLPNYTDPSAAANVLWTQPEDDQIFASFRNDVPASSALFGASTTAASKPTATSSAPAGLTEGSPRLTGPTGSPDATASAAGPGGTPSASPGASSTDSPSASPLPIQARTANQSICAG
jgi:anionic cell wall polymer biosynthesis LytR-Cps2A-Psr (LCP) family protein